MSASARPAPSLAFSRSAPDTTWTTEYYGLAVAALRAERRTVDEEVVLAHISPVHSENVNFFGVIDVDVDGELAKLDPSGFRPLRGGISDGTIP